MGKQTLDTSLWIVSREYAGLAEAGGVKNVVKALAEAACAEGFSVTVFLPRYGSLSLILEHCTGEVCIRVADVLHTVRYFELMRSGIRFIFIDAELFSEKQDIYTYCADEVEHFRKKLGKDYLKKGDGYSDSHEMNILFQKAVLCYGLSNHTAPDVLHCHDGHTAFLPAFIFTGAAGKNLFKHTKCFITIHNAGDGYRQTIGSLPDAAALTGLPEDVLRQGLAGGSVEPFLTGAQYAALTTVSPWYARQLVHPEQSLYSFSFSQVLAERHIPVTGITNGIDFSAYDPRNTERSCLPFTFDIQNGMIEGKYACRSFLLDTVANGTSGNIAYTGLHWHGNFTGNSSEKYVYFIYHGRLVTQKGIDILLHVIPLLLRFSPHVRFIVMGQGHADLEQRTIRLTEEFAGRMVYCKGYNRAAARLIAAAADFILLPSLFEPCGLEDLIAQIYGTIPIAHAEGGLQKITHGKTGFLYTVPDTEKRNVHVHVEKLFNLAAAQAQVFLSSPYSRVYDEPVFKQIITQAYTELLTTFSWQYIFPTYYQKLYRHELSVSVQNGTTTPLY